MNKIILLLLCSVLFNQQAEAARGRQPCSGAKGGIAHCTSDGHFVCNDGSLSQSKRFCSGYGEARTRQQIKPSVPARKTQTKKALADKKQEAQSFGNIDESANIKARQPTCAPLYMSSKPGFTHLPICSGKQY